MCIRDSSNGVDSDINTSSEFAPFLNIMNEWYLRDCSRKIKAVLQLSLIHICLIGAFLWSDKLCLNDVLYHDFKGLPVFFIHCQEEAGKHNDNHCKCTAEATGFIFE